MVPGFEGHHLVFILIEINTRQDEPVDFRVVGAITIHGCNTIAAVIVPVPLFVVARDAVCIGVSQVRVKCLLVGQAGGSRVGDRIAYFGGGGSAAFVIFGKNFVVYRCPVILGWDGAVGCIRGTRCRHINRVGQASGFGAPVKFYVSDRSVGVCHIGRYVHFVGGCHDFRGLGDVGDFRGFVGSLFLYGDIVDLPEAIHPRFIFILVANIYLRTGNAREVDFA